MGITYLFIQLYIHLEKNEALVRGHSSFCKQMRTMMYVIKTSQIERERIGAIAYTLIYMSVWTNVCVSKKLVYNASTEHAANPVQTNANVFSFNPVNIVQRNIYWMESYSVLLKTLTSSNEILKCKLTIEQLLIYEQNDYDILELLWEHNKKPMKHKHVQLCNDYYMQQGIPFHVLWAVPPRRSIERAGKETNQTKPWAALLPVMSRQSPETKTEQWWIKVDKKEHVFKQNTV